MLTAIFLLDNGIVLYYTFTMTLREWIKDNNVKELAGKLKTSPVYLYQISWGRAKPSWEMAMKISLATEGKVTLEELRSDMAKNINQLKAFHASTSS
jgi:hypothetical protein